MSPLPSDPTFFARVLFYGLTPVEVAWAAMNKVDLTTLAVPGFLVLILAERLCNPKAYRLNDTMCSLSLGVVMINCQLWSWHLETDVAARVHEWAGPYRAAYLSDGLQESVAGWPGFVFVALGMDLAYYLFHRISHEHHVAWVGHAAHHSGEDYNFATALRQGALQHLVSWPFVQPLALVFSPSIIQTHHYLNTLVQFWIHSSNARRLPFGLERVLNTPSHHRMHHRPPGNCNYGGGLIVWDRLFGSFVAETQLRDHYGLAKSVGTFDPIAVNAVHAKYLANAPGTKSLWSLLGARRARDAWTFNPAALFAPLPPLDSAPPLRASDRGPSGRKWNGGTEGPDPRAGVSHAYIVLQWVAGMAAGLGGVVGAKHLDGPTRFLCSAFCLATLSSVGKMHDRAPSARLDETCRQLLVLAAGLFLFGRGGGAAAWAVLASPLFAAGVWVAEGYPTISRSVRRLDMTVGAAGVGLTWR